MAAQRLPSLDHVHPVDYTGLHNVVAFAENLYSGSVPEGEQAFITLKNLGIKTVISVDGAPPEVELAKKYGLRYVHLPIGYDGMSNERTLELARAVCDLPGPVYLHCHHGKHRSAGAAGAISVTLGESSPEHATSRMHVSGTAANYAGLFQCVALATIATPDQLDAAADDFPERWKTSGFVQSMVEIDAAFENLKRIEEAGWRTPDQHPDLVPAAEAGRLADLLRTIDLTDARHAHHPPAFSRLMLESSQLAASIEEALLGEKPNGRSLSLQMKSIATDCKECHVKWRD